MKIGQYPAIAAFALGIIAMGVSSGVAVSPAGAMTKDQLAAAMAASSSLSKQQATVAINAFVGEIRKSLLKGEPVYLRNFGTFEMKERAGGMSRIGKPMREKQMAPNLKFSKPFVNSVSK